MSRVQAERKLLLTVPGLWPRLLDLAPWTETWIAMCFFLGSRSRTIASNYYISMETHFPAPLVNKFTPLFSNFHHFLLPRSLSMIHDLTEETEVSKRELPRFPPPPRLTCQALLSFFSLKMSCPCSTGSKRPHCSPFHPHKHMASVAVPLSPRSLVSPSPPSSTNMLMLPPFSKHLLGHLGGSVG